MPDKKISFLVPVHNEEKILARTLNNLSKIPYKNYEVILGLDGCTDKSEEIVKRFAKKFKNKIKYIKLNERGGKPAVIDQIIKKARGEIIVINDADWIFDYQNEETFRTFFSVFEDETVGGIAESFPLEWDKEKIQKGNFGYRLVAYSSYYWLKFQQEKFTFKKRGKIYLKEPTMFLTNIFRKSLYVKNFSLGDDFERTKNIMELGSKLVLFQNEYMPRMKAVYNKISLRDLFKLKIRTAIARKQLDGGGSDVDEKYYLSAFFYMMKNSFRENLGASGAILVWYFIGFSATIVSKFKRIGTKEGWKMRMKR